MGCILMVFQLSGEFAFSRWTPEYWRRRNIGAAGGDTIYLKKNPTDQIFAANAGVLGVGVSLEG